MTHGDESTGGYLKAPYLLGAALMCYYTDFGYMVYPVEISSPSVA